MSHENNSWRPQKMYCPNCSQAVTGYEGKNGVIKMSCGRCGTALVRKPMGRRHDRIDIYAPRDRCELTIESTWHNDGMVEMKQAA